MNHLASGASTAPTIAHRQRRRGAFASVAQAQALAVALALALVPTHGVRAADADRAAGAAPPPFATGAVAPDAGLALRVQQIALDASRAITAAAATRGAPAPRVEIDVGRLDPRLRLAPCERVEPYLPEGTRLWGRARIGLRCVQGTTRWNVYLPVTVKVFAGALVAPAGVAAGTVLAAADLMLAEVDWAEESSAPVVDVAVATGRALARVLKPGQSLRQSHLKARQWFAAGDTIAVRANGRGFSVAGQAQALGNGVEGEPTRFRLDNGRVLTGLPVGDRLVEMSL